MTKVTILDDWQGIAEQSADWAALAARAEISVKAMRERTAFPASLAESDVISLHLVLSAPA